MSVTMEARPVVHKWRLGLLKVVSGGYAYCTQVEAWPVYVVVHIIQVEARPE